MRIALALLVLLAVAPPRLNAASGVPWGIDPSAAFLAAREKHGPVLAYVTAQPCGERAPVGVPSGAHETDCELLETNTLSRPAFVDAAARFVPLLLHYGGGTRTGESDADLLRRWKVATVPTLLVADPWGNEVIRVIGPTPLEKALRVLRSIPDDFAPMRAAGEILRKDPEHLDALLSAAAFYEKAGLAVVAERYYERAADTGPAKADASSRRLVVIARGLNRLRMGLSKEALKLFSEEAGRGLDGPQADAVLFGWSLSALAGGDRAKAQTLADDLARRFPDSAYAKRMAENLKR